MVEMRKMKGLWKLPGQDSYTKSGELTFDPKLGISLELIGFFGGDNKITGVEKHPIIHGITTDRKMVTLLNCEGFSLSQYNFPLKLTNYTAISALLGDKHIVSESELLFDVCSFHFDYLDEWIELSGFDVSIIESSIKYSQPKQIQFFTSKEKDIHIWFSFSGPQIASFIIKSCIEQKTMFQIDFHQQTSIDKLISEVSIIQNFLSLGFSHPTRLTELIVGKRQSDKTDYFEIFTPPNFDGVKDRWLPSSNMLFAFSDLGNETQKVFQNWIKLYSTIQPVLDLYFLSTYGSKSHDVTYFLNLVFALETLHRRTCKRKKFSEDEYKSMAAKLVDALKGHENDSHKNWLSEKIKYGNELSLRSRLIDLIENSHEVVTRKIKDVNRFVTCVVDTRNYHVHFDGSLETKALNGDDLFRYCTKLKVLLQVSLLKQLGFSNEMISNIKRTPTYWNS
jgi:hypothetical protein